MPINSDILLLDCVCGGKYPLEIPHKHLCGDFIEKEVSSLKCHICGRSCKEIFKGVWKCIEGLQLRLEENK